MPSADGGTVVVKWLRSNPEGFRVARRQIATEASALALLGRVLPGVAPGLLGHDPEHDLLVVEDLGPRRTLHSQLSAGRTPVGERGLHAFAGVMGRVHGATSTIPLGGGEWDEGFAVPIRRPEADALLERLRVIASIGRRVVEATEAAIVEIEEDGPFHAFSNGDSGANNALVDDEGSDARLIDFEHACRRHALLDAVALHVPGGRCG